MTTFYTIILTVICYHLLLVWIAGHKELTEAFTANIRKIWERVTRNFGEKEEPEHIDTHAPHVVIKKRDYSID